MDKKVDSKADGKGKEEGNPILINTDSKTSFVYQQLRQSGYSDSSYTNQDR
jgi:hypothetical protein